MGNRFTKATRQRLYDQILERGDPEGCAECGRPPHRAYALTLDHVDGDRDRHDLENLRLLCTSCNTKRQMEARARSAKLWQDLAAPGDRNPSHPSTGARRTPSATWGEGILSESVGDVGLAPQRERTRAIRPDEGSPEMRAGQVYKTVYRKWIYEQLRTDGQVPKEEAIYSGAYVVGCSSQTTDRYLRIWCSAAGDLLEATNESGVKVIRLKERG